MEYRAILEFEAQVRKLRNDTSERFMKEPPCVGGIS